MIQYAAALLIGHDRPGVLDRPVKPGDDSFGTRDDSVVAGNSGSAMSLAP
jgi:hypothetical protein